MENTGTFNVAKGFVIAIATVLSAWLGALYIPVIILVITNVIDYATGLMAAKNRNEKMSSYKGINGISKKVCMWLLVVVGAVIDGTLLYSTQSIGITLPVSFCVAMLVAIWLTCNEVLSILENISDIGVPLPPFMEPVIKQIKSKVEVMSEEKK